MCISTCNTTGGNWMSTLQWQWSDIFLLSHMGICPVNFKKLIKNCLLYRTSSYPTVEAHFFPPNLKTWHIWEMNLCNSFFHSRRKWLVKQAWCCIASMWLKVHKILDQIYHLKPLTTHQTSNYQKQYVYSFSVPHLSNLNLQKVLAKLSSNFPHNQLASKVKLELTSRDRKF